MGLDTVMNLSFKSIWKNLREVGLVLIRPNHARKQIASLKQGIWDTARNLDKVNDEMAILESKYDALRDENEALRNQIFSIKSWIRSAHRLDQKPLVQTIKEALSYEKKA